ncbi:MAG: hypothetical protein PHW01_05295 [Patescibacteria group bacterium]|nr:hypothetical protein [Patescibacteria group bacterium]
MKRAIFILSLFLIMAFLSGCKKEVEQRVDDLTGVSTVRTGQEAEKDLAIAQCKELFQRENADGRDISEGPCLSNEIIPDWVCDTAHNPRQEVDNKSENQCPAFREGKAHHFVELDQNGEVVKTY